MNLINLEPDVREELLLLPPVTKGRAAFSEHNVRDIARLALWDDQRRIWRKRFGPNSG